MHPIPRVAAAQFGVFSTAQATRVGWTQSSLRHAANSSALTRVRHGVYAEPLVASGNRFADELTIARRQAAAVSVVNRRVPVSHGSSAALLGIALIDAPKRVCVTFPRGRRGEITGVHRHRGRLVQGHVIRCGRILLLSPARTVVDLGCELGIDAATVAADSALHLRLTNREELSAALKVCAGWPGVTASARAVQLADPASESVLESLSRLRIIGAGLPAPEPQVTILDHAGHFCGRVDFYWDEFGVVGEADGLGKYEDAPDSLTDEKKRQGWVEDTGLSKASLVDLRRNAFPGPGRERLSRRRSRPGAGRPGRCRCRR